MRNISASPTRHMRRDGRPCRLRLTTARREFARVAAACPVPLVIAGGKKLPELDALKWRMMLSTRALQGWTWAAISFSAAPNRNDSGRQGCSA